MVGRLGRVLPADSPLLWWGGFPIGFALTCVVELPAYLATFWALGWLQTGGPLTMGRSLRLGLAVNLVVTHPTLWLVGLTLGAAGRLSSTTLGAAELGVVFLEGLAIALVTRRPGWSMVVALGVNGLSVVVGLLVLPVVTAG
jgi:hypothetical protein